MTIPEQKFLDKDNKQNVYYLYEEFGIRKRTRIENSLSTIAQKYLRLTSEVDDIPSSWGCTIWLKTHGGEYDECKLAILEQIIEPVTPGSRNVKWLFENEKLDLTEDEIDALCSGFLETPLWKTIAKTNESQTKSAETSPSGEQKTEQPKTQGNLLQDISPKNTETT